jgi:hypothetical protein
MSFVRKGFALARTPQAHAGHLPPTPRPLAPRRGEGPTPPLHPAPLGAGQVTRKPEINAGDLRGTFGAGSVSARR